MSGPKILYTDIETEPIQAYAWGLWDQNISIGQIIQDPEIMGVGYGWNGKPAKYVSKWDTGGSIGSSGPLNRRRMLKIAWDLLDEADVVVHWNGTTFDVPWLNGEFMREGMPPPSPFKQIDLMRVVKRNARFPSNKLDYISASLLGERKHSTGGFQLWIDCMNGDPKARAKMARYCKQDVNLLPKLLEKLRPWLGNQVNFALWSEQGVELACSKCEAGDTYLVPKGWAHTATRSFKQYWCKPTKGGCGGWTRDTRMDPDGPVARSVGVTR